MKNGSRVYSSMREKSSECQTSQVRTMTEMCSREPPAGVLQHHHHPSTVSAAAAVGIGSVKANGKNPASPLNVSSPESRLQSFNHEDDSSQQSGQSGPTNNNANNLPQPGGRLKFFKDGKFILELSHRRDGDRTTWFPVPKKTFWPPPPASLTPNRQESSASLSGLLFSIYI